MCTIVSLAGSAAVGIVCNGCLPEAVGMGEPLLSTCQYFQFSLYPVHFILLTAESGPDRLRSCLVMAVPRNSDLALSFKYYKYSRGN